MSLQKWHWKCNIYFRNVLCKLIVSNVISAEILDFRCKTYMIIDWNTYSMQTQVCSLMILYDWTLPTPILDRHSHYTVTLSALFYTSLSFHSTSVHLLCTVFSSVSSEPSPESSPPLHPQRFVLNNSLKNEANVCGQFKSLQEKE